MLACRSRRTPGSLVRTLLHRAANSLAGMQAPE